MKRKEILEALGPNQISQQKVSRVNPDGTVELTDPTGKITKVKQTELQQDPKDPTGKKLQTTVSAPKNQIAPGAQVSVTTATTEELGFDEISGKSAARVLRQLDQGMSLNDLMSDFPELSRMIDAIAAEHGLHPDDDFEAIEDILLNDLEDIAAQEDDFGDYDLDQDDEQGMSEGPFTGVGKMMMKHKLKKGIKKDAEAEDDAFDNMHDYGFADSDRFSHEDDFVKAHDAKRRKEKALDRLSREGVEEDIEIERIKRLSGL